MAEVGRRVTSPLRLGLPYRVPSQFVQEVVRIDPGRYAECRVEFSDSDPIFAGHFRGNPLVPGVIIAEALAQAAGIAGASQKEDPAAPQFLLTAIRNMKFLHGVRPGETVSLEATKTGEVGNLWNFDVKALVGDRCAASGSLVLAVTGHVQRPKS